MTKKPIHPGHVLLKELDKRGITKSTLGRHTGLGHGFISLLSSGQRNVTASNANRIGRALGISAEYLMKLQVAYDLAVAEEPKFGPISAKAPAPAKKAAAKPTHSATKKKAKKR